MVPSPLAYYIDSPKPSPSRQQGAVAYNYLTWSKKYSDCYWPSLNFCTRNITASFQSVKRGLSSLYRNHHHHHHHNARYDIQGAREEEGVDGGGTSLSFGTAITDTDQVLLLQLMTHMSTYVSKEGLFRKSGNKARIDQLVKGLEGSQFSEVLLQDNYNANDFASVLKQFFSELPEPLLLKRHLDAYLQAAGRDDSPWPLPSQPISLLTPLPPL